ncbi:MAG: MarR family transcriptional regulator [Massiliimalia sp.]
MNELILKTIHTFFHTMTLEELQLMNENYPTKNITYNSLLYLDLIYTHQGEYTASMIAQLLCVSKPAVIMKINELIKLGFVYKKQSDTDKRAYYLFAREELLPQYMIYKKMDEAVAEKMTSRYSQKEIEQFCEMLKFMGDASMEALHTSKQQEVRHE